MKKMSILFLMLLCFQICFIPNIVLADNTDNTSPTLSDVIQGADNFIRSGEETTQVMQNRIQTGANTIYNILFTIGVVITVAFGGILGVQFMIASAEDKAKIKEAMIPYIVGCIVIYGAFGIWKIVVLLGNKIA